jgi:hypothetical protein
VEKEDGKRVEKWERRRAEGGEVTLKKEGGELEEDDEKMVEKLESEFCLKKIRSKFFYIKI